MQPPSSMSPPAATPAPSTTSPSRHSSPPTPPARPSSTSKPPAPPSPKSPTPDRNTAHSRIFSARQQQAVMVEALGGPALGAGLERGRVLAVARAAQRAGGQPG